MIAKTRREKFTEVYQNNVWKGTESVSGTGSDLAQTAQLREILPALVRELGAKSIVDAPCGDLHWMKDVAWEAAGGGVYGGGHCRGAGGEVAAGVSGGGGFECVDLVTDILPRADVIFCRDCLVHLPLAEMKIGGAKCGQERGGYWLVTTTFPKTTENGDVTVERLAAVESAGSAR